MRLSRREVLALTALMLPGTALRAAPESPGPSLTGADRLAALRAGGCVIVMRHAHSPTALPDAAMADPGNAGHERQLDEAGRASARALGDALHELHIPIGQVLSSPAWRALETARLAQLPRVTRMDELGDQGHSMQPEGSGQRGAWLRAKAAQPPGPGLNTLIITHLPNMVEAFDGDALGLADGEALIFRPPGTRRALARISIRDWCAWAGH
jgi:phosphohistidine phosphatase SixA